MVCFNILLKGDYKNVFLGLMNKMNICFICSDNGWIL